MVDTAITVAINNEIGKGDYIAITHSDTRWWARLLYWIFRQGNPTYETYHEVTNATNTTLTITE